MDASRAQRSRHLAMRPAGAPDEVVPVLLAEHEALRPRGAAGHANGQPKLKGVDPLSLIDFQNSMFEI